MKAEREAAREAARVAGSVLDDGIADDADWEQSFSPSSKRRRSSLSRSVASEETLQSMGRRSDRNRKNDDAVEDFVLDNVKAPKRRRIMENAASEKDVREQTPRPKRTSEARAREMREEECRIRRALAQYVSITRF